MPTESALPAKQIVITSRQGGYAHETYRGTCGPDVTVEDIKRQLYHSYFGGRDAWVRDGQWGCVVHTD